MSKTSKKHTAKLSKMKVNELQAKFAEVTGERTRSPNKTFLIRRITEALQTREGEGKGGKGKAAPAGTGESLPPPEKLTKLDVPALQTRYLEVGDDLREARHGDPSERGVICPEAPDTIGFDRRGRSLIVNVHASDDSRT